MLLGEFIQNYRAAHNLSQSDFANISGISRGYISMLEQNKNPASGKPITPSYTIFQKVANCTGLSLNDLISALDDDQLIDVGATLPESFAPGEEYTEGEKELIKLFRLVPPEQRDMILRMIRAAIDAAQ